MESPSVNERSRVQAQEDSSALDQREPNSSLADSNVAGKSVPNVRKDNDSEVEGTKEDVNVADSPYREMSTRLIDDEPVASGSSLDSLEDRKESQETSSISQHYDSTLRNIMLGKDLDDIEAAMYDDNLFSDEALATSSSESTPSRKRPAADFIPINAEIKRIGVEISEEHAKQLKNDIRRLSPVLISLRERTLGEISLTTDSGLFEEADQALRLEIIEENVSVESGTVEQLDEVITPKVLGTIDSTFQASCGVKCEDSATYPSESVSSTSAKTEPKEETIDRLETGESRNDQGPAKSSRETAELVYPNSPLASTFNASGTPNERGKRELVIVLSRFDRESADVSSRNKLSAEQESNDQGNDVTEDSGGVIDETIGRRVAEDASAKPDEEPIARNIVEKCGEPECNDEKVAKSEGRREVTDFSVNDDRPTCFDSPVLVGDICLSPKYHDNDQLRRKSPKVMIERTLEDVASAKVHGERKIDDSGENPQVSNLDCVRRTLANSLEDSEDYEVDDVSSCDPLAIGEDNPRARTSNRIVNATSDLHDPLDTETETETGSDNSELVSIASIRSRDCAEPANDGSACPETDSVVSDEIAGDVMTRLEPERPEAFTEDSAESLALATGARDEVRSDGSDSGLGSEIPGDPGPAPAPESDSETSFLDRIPDDILSDKDKVVNQLEAFVPDAGTSGAQQEVTHQQQQIPLPSFSIPPKSSLKRRLTDCMEGEPSPKRINTDDPMRKKRNIQFDAVTVYYFPRSQGFTCVPSQGGSTLGMSATHTHAERFSLTEHAAEQRRIHRARLAQLRSERAANCVTEAASSSEDPSDDTDEEPSDTEELDIDSYYFLQPVPTWQRRALLRAAGVRRIDAIEKDDCRDIRASREHCGCGCKGYCDPESCPCSRANVKCQVDRAGFPCGCSRDGCANSSGRIEFNPVRVRTHFIHTLMRLQLEKKQRDEDRTETDMLSSNQIGRGPMREVAGLMASPLGSLEHPSVIGGDQVSCINATGFTTLHYENHEPQSQVSCQPVHGTREDSLDLYAIRDDCYPTDDVDAGPSAPRKLHPEFGQAFQTFPGQQPTVSFSPTPYQDYQAYQTLATTSRSQFQPQFQTVPPANQTFAHYPYGQDPVVMQSSCQTHQPTVSSHHPSVYDNAFAHEESPGNQQQYTNLNSVQPMNAVVQQMGKLEPFSELLAGRYSYYGDVEPQPSIGSGYHNNGETKIEPEKSPIVEGETVDNGTEDCDENFGEIIKKSMVETVSA